jgi:hypothetical protein
MRRAVNAGESFVLLHTNDRKLHDVSEVMCSLGANPVLSSTNLEFRLTISQTDIEALKWRGVIMPPPLHPDVGRVWGRE